MTISRYPVGLFYSKETGNSVFKMNLYGVLHTL